MDAVWIALIVLAVVVIGAAVYWMTRGKEQRLEQKRVEATEQRQEAQTAAQRAGEAEVAAKRHAQEAEAERERALELERKANETDPDHNAR